MKNLIKEMEATIDTFFSNATDDEFWLALERADNSVYSKVDLPILDMHESIAEDFHSVGHYLIPVEQKEDCNPRPEHFRYVKVVCSNLKATCASAIKVLAQEETPFAA